MGQAPRMTKGRLSRTNAFERTWVQTRPILLITEGRRFKSCPSHDARDLETIGLQVFCVLVTESCRRSRPDRSVAVCEPTRSGQRGTGQPGQLVDEVCLEGWGAHRSGWLTGA